ncbi:MAG: molybdopterin-dependent oxidoreductase [Planctomycetota bacterium]
MKEPRSQRRLPPGQQLAAPGKWPLVGERVPDPVCAPWSLQILGLVTHPQVWTFRELTSFPTVERTIDVHCVTRWSMLDAVWRGVPLLTLLAETLPTAEARFLSFVSRSPRRHSTSLPLADIERLDPLIAWQWHGEPISEPHGGPLRLIVPDRYFYKSLKWLDTIELLAEDRLGYWEREAGYHNRADPWREERFVAAGVSRAEAGRILRDRDLAGLNVLGLDGSNRDLAGLRATGAVLRAADFSRSQLSGSDFRQANLSGASFRNAVLAGADFSAADVEGADFRGADLRGADFRGASLFGVWLVDESRDESPESRVAAAAGETRGMAALGGERVANPVSAEKTQVDGSTRFDPGVWEQLSPAQAAFLARSLDLPPLGSSVGVR